MPEPSELEGMRNLIGNMDKPLTFGQGQRKRERLGDETDRSAPAKTAVTRTQKPQETRSKQEEGKKTADDHVAPPTAPTTKAPEDMTDEEMRALRGEPLQTTVYLWPDQKKHLALRKVHGRGDISEQVRAMLDRVGACDDQWAQ